MHFKSINAMLIDNYIASAFGDMFVDSNVRIDRFMDHAITYGIRMAHGSEKLEKCLRKYLRDHQQEVFDMLTKSFDIVKVRIQALLHYEKVTQKFCRTTVCRVNGKTTLDSLMREDQ